MGRSTLKKRIAVYFVAGLVSIFGAAACGGGEPEPQQPKQEEPKQVDPKQEDPKQVDPEQEEPKQESQQKKDQPY